MVKLYQFLKKSGVAISLTIGLIINIIMYVVIIGGYPAGNPSEEELFASSIFDFALMSNYALFFISIITIVVFLGVQTARDPRRSAPSMLGTLGVILLFVILYATSGGELRPEYLRIDPNMPSSTVSIVEACLFLTYIFTFASVASMVVISAYTAFRNR